jgi:DNA adenine methylase
MKSPLCYIGGKSQLSRTIVQMIPGHRLYVEVFAGAAWVFFRKEPSKYEVINDIDSDLVTFYRVLQNHLDEFVRQFRWMLSSREWFEDWKKQIQAGGLTDIQRAARYYYLQRHAFGGKVRGRTYAASPMKYPPINLLRIEEELSAVHLRLARVTIENLSWDRILKAYDRPATLFYLDPPYWKKPVYQHNMIWGDYERLGEALKGIKGRFIVSINDLPEIRELFNEFILKPVELKYFAGREKAVQARELLVSNFSCSK